MTAPTNLEEAIDEILADYQIGFVVGDKNIDKHVAKFKQAISQAVKAHIITDILGICLETERPGEFPSVEALKIRDKIVLKYLVT